MDFSILFKVCWDDVHLLVIMAGLNLTAYRQL